MRRAGCSPSGSRPNRCAWPRSTASSGKRHGHGVAESLQRFDGTVAYVDAVPLVAYLDRSHPFHEACRAFVSRSIDPSGAIALVTSSLTLDQPGQWHDGPPGWRRGGGRERCVGSSGGTILKTTDGGGRWIGQTSGTSTDLISVAAVSPTTAWVGGGAERY